MALIALWGNKMDKIGFIGLGRMGLSMAANIVKSGTDVWGFDTQTAQTAAFKERGGHLCASIADVAAQSDIIITMLPNSEIVDAVIAGPGGVLSTAKAGATIMDMSTVRPETSDKMAALCLKQNIGFIDAPVGRLASHADAGQSLFMVGGEVSDFDRVLPLLNVMGSEILSLIHI